MNKEKIMSEEVIKKDEAIKRIWNNIYKLSELKNENSYKNSRIDLDKLGDTIQFKCKGSQFEIKKSELLGFIANKNLENIHDTFQEISKDLFLQTLSPGKCEYDIQKTIDLINCKDIKDFINNKDIKD